MVSVLFGLCALTSLMCAFLLLRAYFRSRSLVLWWSGLCFAGLMVSNVVLVFDKLVFTNVNLQVWRLAIILVSLALLLYGLIYADE